MLRKKAQDYLAKKKKTPDTELSFSIARRKFRNNSMTIESVFGES